MSPATGARRRAREVAFRVAYQADIAGETYAQAWTLRREHEDRLSADQLQLIDDVVALLESGAAAGPLAEFDPPTPFLSG